LGTTRIASRSGHTPGPPAENAYAVDPVGVDTKKPRRTPNVDTGRPFDFDDHPEHTQPRALFQAGLVERPALVDDPAPGDDDIERQAFLHPVVPRDDVLQHQVDGLGLGLGQEADPGPG